MFRTEDTEDPLMLKISPRLGEEDGGRSILRHALLQVLARHYEKFVERKKKSEVIYKGRIFRLTADFPAATLDTKTQKNKDCQKTLWDNDYEFRSPYLNFFYVTPS